ncbi:DNA integrity scanning protein DisA nucleotide-binding domain protein [Mycoplasmatota bacterium zrk1]
MQSKLSEIVKDENYTRWIDQFDEADKRIILKLLSHYKYIDSDIFFKLLRTLYEKLIAEYNIDARRTLFVPVGYTAKSGAAVAYFFKRENDLEQESFIEMKDISINRLVNIQSVVFLDDFIGTGEYINSIKEKFIHKLSEKISRETKFIAACIVGYQQGIDAINDNTIEVCVGLTIPYSMQPLHEDSVIFDSNEKEEARLVLTKYNKPLKEKHPLGYGGIQGLVSFFFATPNNTLPIFWSSSNGWYPLFPRGDSRRNPYKLIEFPKFLQKGNVFSSDFNLRIIKSDEVTREMFDTVLSLDKMNILAEIFFSLKFSDEFILEILHAIRKYQDLKHENKPVCCSMTFFDAETTHLVKDNLVATANDLFFHDREKFKKHLMVIDGWKSTLAINGNGKVLGVLNYMCNEIGSTNAYNDDKYKMIEYTSNMLKGLLIVFTNDNRVLLYYNGCRIMTKKEKNWHIQGSLKDLSNIAIAHNIIPEILDKVIEISFKISDKQEGALFCIGDEDIVRKNSSKMGDLRFAFKNNNVLNADENGMISQAVQDGAMIISSKGEIIDSMVKLDPPNDVVVKAEDNKGTRHNSAKKMSVVTNAILIVISSDGPISIYAKGKRIMRMLG